MGEKRSEKIIEDRRNRRKRDRRRERGRVREGGGGEDTPGGETARNKRVVNERRERHAARRTRETTEANLFIILKRATSGMRYGREKRDTYKNNKDNKPRSRERAHSIDVPFTIASPFSLRD